MVEVLKKIGCKKLAILLLLICFTLLSRAQDTAVRNVVKIARSWQLPPVLQNISAIDYISPDKIACLQEEMGIIFIFNLETSKIDKQITFGPPGDYEGLVRVGGKAYVACADGRILEISNLNADTPEVKEFGTHLTVTENVNGLCYDRKNKRLLVTIKGTEDANQHYKDIYAFNLVTGAMPVKPVIRIDLSNRIFRRLQPKNMQTIFQPSDLDINPINGQLYIIDGTRGQLLRMRLSENLRDLKQLDKSTFFQPEGISITPSGEIFIASKGDRDEAGKLLQIRIK